MGFFGKIVGKAVNDAIYKASDGRKPVSTDYSKAAINIIKHKIENITLAVSMITTLIFLCFYGFMMASKRDVVNIIIYAVLAVLLLASSVLDFILFSASRKEMNFLEKRSFNWYKKLKRNSILIFKLVIKLFSIGYAIYIIIRFGSNTSNMIGITMSIVALVIQLAVHYLGCFITDCINYIVIGLTMDVDSSGILFLVDKNQRAKSTTNEILRTKSDKKIIEDLEIQKEKDSNEKRDDDEIKIKYGKYQLECKKQANEYVINEKKLNELISASFGLFNRTKEINNTPEEFLSAIYYVEAKLDKRYDKIDDESYLNAIAFLVYYTTIYDYTVNFNESNERYIVDKIFNEIKGLEEFIIWMNNNK